MSGLYLHSPLCGGVGGERDSGYDSLRRRMSVLDRLTQTHPVWLLLTVSEEEAGHILLKQPPGVRRHSSVTQILALNIISGCVISYYFLHILYMLVWCRYFWSGSRPLCRERFCLFVLRRIS